MRILAFILLCGVMFGLSGCGGMMIGNNEYDDGTRNRAPKQDGGLINGDNSKYYWGDIRITTIPAGLEVELYNRGKLAEPREYEVERLTEETTTTRIRGERGEYAYEICLAVEQKTGQDYKCDSTRSTTTQVYRTNTYSFNEGLRDKTTPTTARLYARTPENDASKYVLVFKKNGKEITRREIKTYINWWVYADLPMAMPTAFITLLSFPFEMAWLNFRTKDAHYTQTRSYLTQGDIEIDLTEEIKKLGL